MYTPRQIWQHVTPKTQLLIALSLATVLAFSVGLASGIYGRATAPPAHTADRNAVPAVAQPHQAAPAVPQRPAVTARVAGSGSAYDGSAYVEYLAARPAASNPNVPAYVEYLAARPASNPNVLAIGAGSVYDGGHYGSSIPAPLTSPNVPISGTGSAYGGDYRLMRTTPLAPINPNVPISGTGSAYNGQ
jgi:hypothetical protein